MMRVMGMIPASCCLTTALLLRGVRRQPRVPQQNLPARLPPRERPVSSKRGLDCAARRPQSDPRRSTVADDLIDIGSSGAGPVELCASRSEILFGECQQVEVVQVVGVLAFNSEIAQQ